MTDCTCTLEGPRTLTHNGIKSKVYPSEKHALAEFSPCPETNTSSGSKLMVCAIDNSALHLERVCYYIHACASFAPAIDFFIFKGFTNHECFSLLAHNYTVPVLPCAVYNQGAGRRVSVWVGVYMWMWVYEV